MRATFIIGLPLLLQLSVASLSHAEPPPAESRGVRGNALILLNKRTVAMGEKLQFVVVYHHRGETARLFNPYLNRLMPLPAKLNVYSQQREHLGDLLTAHARSRRGPTESDWVTIPHGGVVGAEIAWERVGHLPGSLIDATLKPGTYYLELVYVAGFTSFDRQLSPDPTGEELARAYQGFDQTETIRSEWQAIEIVAAE